jgi:hypothetical protein
MSFKSLALLAGMLAGTFAFGDRANAQIVTSGYTYAPGVVSTSYYVPASSWYYTPGYYTTPYVSSYYTTPYYSSGYYNYPYYSGYYPTYYGGYPYTSSYSAWPRRWWR